MSHDADILEQFPPEKLLDRWNYRVILPAIEMMGEVETVEQYLEYERANRNRGGIIRELTKRRDVILDKHGETPSQYQEESTATSSSPSSVGSGSSDEPSMPSPGLLTLIDEHGPGGIKGVATPPSWDEL